MEHDVRRVVAQRWNDAAPTFDMEPDHGLNDPVVRAAWLARLRAWLPDPPAEVADLGCGTGSLTVLLAEEGYVMRGVDLSPRMLDRAEVKGRHARVRVTWAHGDAADPPIAAGSLDVVLVRHVVWTLPDPVAALARWVALLRPGGQIVLVEGRWSGVALHDDSLSRRLPWASGVGAAELLGALSPLVATVQHVDLAGEDVLWGRRVDDERYAVIGQVSI